MKINKNPNKHLAYNEREFIEIGLTKERNSLKPLAKSKKHDIMFSNVI